jgi:hypothetical protein
VRAARARSIVPCGRRTAPYIVVVVESRDGMGGLGCSGRLDGPASGRRTGGARCQHHDEQVGPGQLTAAM